MKLQEYDFQLIHKPGNTQKKVDALSQRPDYIQGKDNNKNQTLLKKRVVQEFHNARRRVLEKNRRSRGVYRGRSERSSRTS